MRTGGEVSDSCRDSETGHQARGEQTTQARERRAQLPLQQHEGCRADRAGEETGDESNRNPELR